MLPEEAADSADPSGDELRRALEKCRQAERHIEQLRREIAHRDDFIATAAHELRNPMTAVLVNVSSTLLLARRSSDTPPWLRARLESLERQARHFVRRATSLLDATRLAQGRFAIDPKPVELGPLVTSVLAELGPEAERARCRLDVAIQPGVRGRWDPSAIETIAVNLVSNAIKYGAGKPIGVEVRSQGGTAVLVVADHGIGIAPQDQGRIFERFERGEGARDRPGFGIGLWIARQLARAHGGEILVESEPGRGSVFTAGLPQGIHEPQQ